MTETAQSAPAGRGVRLPRTARRAQLLAAAQDVFVANGYHAAAMDEIAERAGVSKPVLYQHFPGKLELYMALLESHVDELVGRVRTAIGSTTDNKLRVRAAVAAFYDFVDGEGQAFRMVFESDLRSEPAVQSAVERATTDSVDAITDTITADAGLDEERARLLAVGLVGLSQVTARSWLADNRRVPKEDAVALISNLAWRGIGGGFPLQH
ncbi:MULTISPECIES: TetR/AcrR family transcriptional regulator [Lentzea]|uniref:Transcriptional regulator, TetR family n=4 Tax=Lentzea TaxID=165301 RepID=A0A1W2FJR3_9PSEU|nr:MULTISPECIES: TetR/AcrR family transcriptional regulator [Lentzea]MCX2952182.1 TetR/AcrR family transcriptional regulator [Lentzea sp. NEAU-D7]MDX8056589.1 TetR/AcrR family transcriptional regulator [Lentzea sp. BCCO 10_0798]RDI30759.1 TetR family transcriptional regulator [Lentzea flaviverrucosa]SDM07050.1 transcriptional regulator, TetR family [Lentzea albidocapillata subsp. violacea]SER27814.1 transcriptional regulator, TetR family [Lentzea flaviverrucosa]